MQAATMATMVNVMQAAALQFEFRLFKCGMCCSICNSCHKKRLYTEPIFIAGKAGQTWGSGFCPCCWGSSAPSAEKDSAQPDLQQPICSSSPLMTMIDVPPDPSSAGTHAWKAAPSGAQDLHTKNSKPSIVCALRTHTHTHAHAHTHKMPASYNQIASHTLKLPVNSVKQY